MKKIIIMVHGNNRMSELAPLAKILFPECEIRVVSAGGEDHTSIASEGRIQGPESRIEES
jgi:hypothetical protein